MGMALVTLLYASPAIAQSPARLSLDTAVAFDLVRGQNAPARPNLVIDLTASLRLGRGWVLYARPWLRQPRDPRWETVVYQAAVQHERPGRVASRIDLGYIASPTGLGMMDMHAALNPTILPHLSYVIPMPVFDPGAPPLRPVANSYPLGAQLAISTGRWDGRAALVMSAPTRAYTINREANPRATPALVAGAGVAPTMGLRLGASLAYGRYATADEVTAAAGEPRTLTLVSLEGEYSWGYTKVSGEVTRDRFTTAAGVKTAYAWFVQGMQTLAPRWFMAVRHEGVNAPAPWRNTAAGSRSSLHVTEATVGFRLSRDFALRTSALRRKPYGASDSDEQMATSLVWAKRW
jgi:hypothetical protein